MFTPNPIPTSQADEEEELSVRASPCVSAVLAIHGTVMAAPHSALDAVILTK